MFDAKYFKDSIDSILERARKLTPIYIRGLIIPDVDINQFFFCLQALIDRAEEVERLRKQIMETTHNSQKAVDNFVLSLCTQIKDGKIKIEGCEK